MLGLKDVVTSAFQHSHACEQVSAEDREWCAGLQTAVFAPWVARLADASAAQQQQQAPEPSSTLLEVRLLDVELEPVLLAKAAHLGLPPPWVARLARLDNQRRQVGTICHPACMVHGSSAFRPPMQRAKDHQTCLLITCRGPMCKQGRKCPTLL